MTAAEYRRINNIFWSSRYLEDWPTIFGYEHLISGNKEAKLQERVCELPRNTGTDQEPGI